MGEVEDPFGLVGTTLERRFAIDRVVARGGFGVVYQGRHITLKKPVAVKVLFIPTGLGPQEKQAFLLSFEQEAQTLAALEHPAIVRAYDFGIARPPGRRELPWLALEWLDGDTLATVLAARAAPYRPAEALATLRPVMQALAFAHARGVAHRDIKPANVMLPRAAGEASAEPLGARLLDFGIAKIMRPDEAVGSGATRTMAAFSAFSTPYAAPEQKNGTRTGPWTDVHAIGLVLTEMLTGRAPYPGDDPVTVELAIVAPTRPTPARHGVDVGAWEPVLARAVALNAADRYEDLRALLAALEAEVPGEASRAPTPAAPSTVSPSTPAAHAPTAMLSVAAPAPPGPDRRPRALRGPDALRDAVGSGHGPRALRGPDALWDAVEPGHGALPLADAGAVRAVGPSPRGCVRAAGAAGRARASGRQRAALDGHRRVVDARVHLGALPRLHGARREPARRRGRARDPAGCPPELTTASCGARPRTRPGRRSRSAAGSRPCCS
jgi:serine/threonine protein kinase